MASQFQTWDNPMGTDGFEFIEFAAPDPVAMGKLFEQMGFVAVAKHRSKNVLPIATGSGAANSMNSKPSVPIGLSQV